MTDSDDFSADKTARDKYDMDEKPQTENKLEKAKRAAARLAHSKEYAFFCYSCREHGLSYVRFEDHDDEGPKQFRVSCGKCCWSPKKKYASLEQVERFQRARERIQSSASPPPVWPPEPRNPVVQNEAASEAWEKLFGPD